jgi:hypothetical protein
MKKLKLDADLLRVETFTPVPEASARGTVGAMQGSVYRTCQIPTACEYYTCDGPTCYYRLTCGGWPQETCALTCPDA